MKLFEKNVGDADKAVRVLVGLVALYAALARLVAEPWSYVAILLAIGMFFTAWTGSCGVYSFAGMSTCPMKAEGKPARKKKK